MGGKIFPVYSNLCLTNLIGVLVHLSVYMYIFISLISSHFHSKCNIYALFEDGGAQFYAHIDVGKLVGQYVGLP